MNHKSLFILGIIGAIGISIILALSPVSYFLESLSDDAAARKISAQADYQEALGERILKEAEGNALESSVDTANRLVTFWGLSFPLVIPVSIFSGLILGALSSGSIFYVVGYKSGLRDALPKSEKDDIPPPAVLGS